ncbi:MAG: winged helix DNA-binding domain-containing protein [Acidobacteriota bacterium]|nr:winged helix DNA-binding domain-containing protein [Acidobacteriota bacterium]
MNETIDVRAARRLALCRAGLLKPEWTEMPRRASGRGKRARTAAHRIIQRFGYLQLDTVAIAGARSHSIVLQSRLEGFDPSYAEELLQPGEPIFEFWGHEASWIPLELYPTFGFRREDFRHHPWWGDLIGQHPEVARDLRRRICDEGPLRSLDMEGGGSRGWWDLKVAKKVATAMWSSGELAIRERRNFQRTYDLPERVIPESWRRETVPRGRAIETLALQALAGHGWATTGTISQTFRLAQKDVVAALDHPEESNDIVPCNLILDGGRMSRGWIQPTDLDLAVRLQGIRPRHDRGVLLSPFDPVLWDRNRVQQLFAFHQMLEIFKPAAKRLYGYYCLPVLAGERLVARYDLKADRKSGTIQVLSRRFEGDDPSTPTSTADGEAARSALKRYALSVGLEIKGLDAG